MSKYIPDNSNTYGTGEYPLDIEGVEAKFPGWKFWKTGKITKDQYGYIFHYEDSQRKDAFIRQIIPGADVRYQGVDYFYGRRDG